MLFYVLLSGVTLNTPEMLCYKCGYYAITAKHLQLLPEGARLVSIATHKE